jgi:hypothetical protein
MSTDRSAAPDAVPAAREGERLGALWFGLLGAPAAWAVQLVALDAFVELGCSSGGFSSLGALVIVITIGAAIVGAAALWTAWSCRRTFAGREEAGATGERASFMATVGLACSGLFLLLILLSGLVPRLFLTTCGR